MFNKTEKEQRKYLRLDTVFPVEFQFIDENRNPTSSIFQGFTRNVGRGGMSIEVKSEKNRDVFKFIPDETRLGLIINIPSSALATKSYAVVRWSKKISEYILDTHIFGVEYEEIEPANKSMIERHVTWISRKSKFFLLFFVLLLIFAILLTYLGTSYR